MVGSCPTLMALLKPNEYSLVPSPTVSCFTRHRSGQKSPWSQQKTEQKWSKCKGLHTIQGYRSDRWSTSADASSEFSRMLPANKRARIHDRMTEDIKPVLNDIRKEERTISVPS